MKNLEIDSVYIENIDIDYKTLASHFNKTNEAMRQLRRKYEFDMTGLWSIYVKAYNYDTIK